MRTRKHVYYSGTVQGVGFRYTARRLARGRGVTGFVRNLADGRVEMAAEGEESVVDGFLADVADAFTGAIREAAAATEPPTGEDAGFVVSFEEG